MAGYVRDDSETSTKDCYHERANEFFILVVMAQPCNNHICWKHQQSQKGQECSGLACVPSKKVPCHCGTRAE
eukprot:9068022-Prorocentrum_lima.AAC.1